MEYGLVLIDHESSVVGISQNLPQELINWLHTTASPPFIAGLGNDWLPLPIPGWEARGVALQLREVKQTAVVLRPQELEQDGAEALRSQLTQMEKMAAVGQLAAGVAHEINNPVGFVSANLNTLRQYSTDLLQLLDLVDQYCRDGGSEKLAQIEQQKQKMDYDYFRDDLMNLVTESLDGLERVKHIVQALKDFSRQDPGVYEVVDIHQCIDSTLVVVNNELKYKANIVKQYGDVGLVECIPQRLNQVIMNLLVNAGHAIDNRGTITIRTGQADSGVFIEIEDTGCGIDENNLRRIFEPFFTTKPVGVGTGLGLSVSYGIIQQHEGKLEVRSQLGVGTCFRIWLPLQRANATATQSEVNA